MLRLIFGLLGAALVTVANAQTLGQEFGEWTVMCADKAKFCGIVDRIVAADDPRYWLNVVVQRSKSELQIIFEVPRTAKPYRLGISLTGDRKIKGMLFQECYEKKCVAAWNLTKKDVEDLLSNETLAVQYGVDASSGTGFSLALTGLKDALDNLAENLK